MLKNISFVLLVASFFIASTTARAQFGSGDWTAQPYVVDDSVVHAFGSASAQFSSSTPSVSATTSAPAAHADVHVIYARVFKYNRDPNNVATLGTNASSSINGTGQGGGHGSSNSGIGGLNRTVPAAYHLTYQGFGTFNKSSGVSFIAIGIDMMAVADGDSCQTEADGTINVNES